MTRIFSAAFHGLATIGVASTAVHVLPNLWTTSLFDFIAVGASLFLAAVMLGTKAITGDWPR